MAWFKLMSEMMDGYTVQLTIRKDGDKLVVLLVPKLDVSKEEVQREIVPLTLTGTPEELDQAFFLSIAGALKQATGLQINLTEFEAGLKKAAVKAGGKDKKVAVPAKDTKPVEKTAAIDFDAKVNKETGEIKEEPKSNSVKPAKAKTEEKPVIEAPKEEKVPFDSGTTASNDGFDDEDW